MYEGYAAYGATELWNNKRTLAYLNGNIFRGVTPLKDPAWNLAKNPSVCATLDPYLCNPPGSAGYLSPAMDPAPWFDPGNPDSVDFAGLFVEEVSAFAPPVKREVRDGAIIGGSLGPLRYGPRIITVTGWLLARTCCGSEYGLQWLTEALAGSNCDDCALDDLFMLKCCPPDPASCRLVTRAVHDTTVTPLTLTVTQTSPGVFDIDLVDSGSANILSDPDGAVSTANGAALVCLNTGIATFALTDGDDLYPITFHPDATTINTSAAAGTGWQITATIDTTITACGGGGDAGPGDPCCRAELDALYTTRASLARYEAASGGLASAVDPVGTVQCREVVTGATLTDIGRTMLRTGLANGPTVLERHGTCCTSDCGRTMLRVQFSLVSESPYLYSEVEWCAADEPFPGTTYCIDWDTICSDNCADTIGVQFVEREVPRPSCLIEVRHDGTWCPVGWSPDPAAWPPADCIVEVAPVDFDPADATRTSASPPSGQCRIALNGDRTWSGLDFDPALGMPPEFCEVVPWNVDPSCPDCEAGESGEEFCGVLLDPDTGVWLAVGWDPAVAFPPRYCTPVASDLPNLCVGDDTDVHCAIRVIYDATIPAFSRFEYVNEPVGCTCFDVVEWCVENPLPAVDPCIVNLEFWPSTGQTRWTPVRWSGDLSALGSECRCLAVGEVTVYDDISCPVPAAARAITITPPPPGSYTGTWAPQGWAFDPGAAFPPADAASFYIPDQNTAPVTEVVELPSNLFVPDCGPLPLMPPTTAFAPESCYCLPIQSRRLCCTLNNAAEWNDATTVIEVATGSAELRNLRIAAYANPFADQDVTCPCDPNDEFWLCREPCSTIEVPQLPSGATLTIDSRLRQAVVRFRNGTTANGLRYLESGGQAIFQWLDVPPCAQLCIVASVASSVADDATVSIGVVSRFLASGG